LDCRRRGGGGGGIVLPVLPPETLRGIFRVEEMDDVRCMLGAGEDGSDSRVGCRGDDTVSGTDLGVRIEPERWGSWVLEEFALDSPRFASRAPRREGGGAGGDLAPGMGS